MRELKNLPPEERRARVRALRGLPPEKPGQDRPEARRPSHGTCPGRNGSCDVRARADGGAARILPRSDGSPARRMRELEEKLRNARREAMRASVAREFNEQAIRERAMDVAKMEAEMAVIRARALSRVRPPLTATRSRRLQNPPLLQGGARPELRRDEPVPGTAPRGSRATRTICRPGPGPSREAGAWPRARDRGDAISRKAGGVCDHVPEEEGPKRL